MLRVKICGITQVEHGIAAAAAGADYLGFIFVPGTRRYLQPAAAGRLIGALRAELGPARLPQLVGLFVNDDPVFVDDVAEACGLDFVQLHGDEPPEQVARLARPVIRAFRPRSPTDLALVGTFAALGARILIDAYQVGHWGGSGVTGDWTLAADVARRYPIMLAGGLSPANVAQAVRLVRPWGVDVSSGVETAGRKDPEKIQAFVEAARQGAAGQDAVGIRPSAPNDAIMSDAERR